MKNKKQLFAIRNARDLDSDDHCKEKGVKNGLALKYQYIGQWTLLLSTTSSSSSMRGCRIHERRFVLLRFVRIDLECFDVIWIGFELFALFFGVV